MFLVRRATTIRKSNLSHNLSASRLKWREFPRFITFESSDSNKRGEVVMVLFLAGMSEGLKILGGRVVTWA